MSWKGTLALLILAVATLLVVFSSGRTRTRSPQEPLLNIQPEGVSGITVREGGGEFSLYRTNGLWMVHSHLIPAPDRADGSMIRSLLTEAAGTTALNSLEPADLKGSVSLESLDLKVPKRSLVFHDGTAKAIDFGVDGPAQGQLYARLEGGKTVYLITADLARASFRPAEEFRDRRLTALSPERLEEITLTKGNSLQTLSLKNVDSDWNLISPVTARANNDAVSSWCGGLLSATIDRWMQVGTDPAACGMDTPTAIISAREPGSTSPVTITVGSGVPGTPDSQYVRCSDRPGICVVRGLARALECTPSLLRSRQPKPLKLDSVDRIEIHPPSQPPGETPLLISRKKGSEDWETAGGGSTFPATQVETWFGKLQSLSADSFVPATPDKLESYGLNQPTVIRFFAHLSENSAEESAGDRLLAEYSLGSPRNGVFAFREGKSSDLMIIRESAQDLTKGPKPNP